MSILDFLSGGSDPSQAANKYLDQIAPMEKEYYNPYIEKGNKAYDQFAPQLDQMTSNPVDFLEMLMKQYQPSSGFQMRNDNALKAAGNSAAAGGMRGSINDINNEAGITDTLLGNDMQQWLNNVFGRLDKGIEGEQNLYGTGFNATQNLTGDLANVLGTQGSLAFQGAQNKNKGFSDMLSAITKIAGGAAGFMAGGPMGASAGANLLPVGSSWI